MGQLPEPTVSSIVPGSLAFDVSLPFRVSGIPTPLDMNATEPSRHPTIITTPCFEYPVSWGGIKT
eukprot:CAMPEP_0203657298 /NCGR_PEP_ID=MMETSP0088-20131115/44381_1 /ASSEMBLY_ACC=CAM_ASM_001087 /TAXON_ID=426623 /ORGANISM="Chaetoceros affinis, Strain CCMP159" /LENGTH=64 /DNA_ID=CAMNT_0050518551 /DNA_START=441 /DNA_END=631 /DNA_ORIENTATION=+